MLPWLGCTSYTIASGRKIVPSWLLPAGNGRKLRPRLWPGCLRHLQWERWTSTRVNRQSCEETRPSKPRALTSAFVIVIDKNLDPVALYSHSNHDKLAWHLPSHWNLRPSSHHGQSRTTNTIFIDFVILPEWSIPCWLLVVVGNVWVSMHCTALTLPY